MKNRLLAWILTALMFIQCIPMNVFAVEEVVYVEDVSYTYVNPEYADIVDEDDFSSHSYYNVPELAIDPSDYHSSAADLANDLKEGMKKRDGTIVLYYTTPYAGANTLQNIPWDDIWDIATAHGTDPKGGDYISHNGTGYNAYTDQPQVMNGMVYCYLIYQVYYFTTDEQEAEVDAEVDRVLGEIITEGMDDYQKVKAIYDYICANVTYDYANLNDSSYKLKHSAYAALINKTAVCQGYALLFYRMALEVGIDARYISGIGGGGPHGWNIVELEDLYYNLDSTWDAGESTYSYFLRSNENFVNHSRDSEYNTTAFILKYPMGTEDYVYMGTPAVSNECGDGVEWNFDSETGTLYINYTGSGSGEMYNYTTLEPSPWSEYEDKITKCIIEEGVTTIGSKTLGYCALSEVSLPSSLKSIGEFAFCYCNNLNSVILPDGLTSLGNGAFIGTPLTEITIPASLTSLGEYAFYYCTSLTKVTFEGNVPSSWGENALTIIATIYYNEGTTGWTTPTWTAPDGTTLNTDTVAQIIASGNCGAQGDNVKWTIDSAGILTIFGEGEMNEYQESLGVPWLHQGSNHQQGIYESIITKVVIEEGVTLISSNIFCDCEELLTIHIPKSVVLIGEGVVCSCDKLVYIYVDADNMNYTSVDGVLFTKNMKTLHTYPTGLNPQEYIVPETVQRIGRRAFYGCESLENIYLPNGLITIGEGAFSGCSGLTEVNIPNGVTTIEHSAFAHCSGLTNVTLPSELITLGGFSFAYCRNIVNILLPNKLHEIGNEAFMRCSGLLNIIIPKSVTSLGYCAFDYCDNLSTVIFESNVPLMWGNEYFVSYVIPQTATIYYNEGTTGWTTPTWTSPDGLVYNTVMIEAPEPENKQGDIDGNGTVDVDDVLICLDLAFVTPTEEQLKLADLDKDGDVDVDDVLICLDLCFA